MKLELPPPSAPSPLRRYLIWWLLLAYALAAGLPQVGDALRRVSLGQLPFSGSDVNPTHWLLAWLLFSVGLSTRLSETRQLWRHPRLLARGLAGGWLVPLACFGLLAVIGRVTLSEQALSAFLAGGLLVVAMPPANSASVWSELSGAEVIRTVGVIVLGTLLCPFITPLLLSLFAPLVGTTAVGPAAMRSSLETLGLFVVLPVLGGMVTRAWLQPAGEAATPGWLRMVHGSSIIALLVLNYSNGAVALPKLVQNGVSLTAAEVASATCLLCGFVFIGGLYVGRRMRQEPPAEQLSFVYVTSMKNTGAALVLASTVVANEPLAALVPVFYTVAQHLAAAVLDRSVIREVEIDPPVESEHSMSFAQATTSSY
ncbi:MAG: bile acid:sodium symporter [Planctomycetaceae bacterium]